MRRARVLRARLTLRVTERARGLLVLRRAAVRRDELARLLAPRRVGQRLRSRRVAGHRRGERRASTKERAAVEKSVTCDRNEIFHWITSLTRARKSREMFRPSVFTVFRFST